MPTSEQSPTPISPSAEKREQMLRRAVLKIQSEGGDWRILAKRLGIPKTYARLIWRRVLTDEEPPASQTRSPRERGRKPKGDLRVRAIL
jgi:hypothetical protein